MEVGSVSKRRLFKLFDVANLAFMKGKSSKPPPLLSPSSPIVNLQVLISRSLINQVSVERFDNLSGSIKWIKRLRPIGEIEGIHHDSQIMLPTRRLEVCFFENIPNLKFTFQPTASLFTAAFNRIFSDRLMVVENAN